MKIAAGSEQALLALAADASLPVFLVTVENNHIIDVRVATRDFLLANLAGEALTQHGGRTCNAGNAGGSRSRSA